MAPHCSGALVVLSIRSNSWANWPPESDAEDLLQDALLGQLARHLLLEERRRKRRIEGLRRADDEGVARPLDCPCRVQPARRDGLDAAGQERNQEERGHVSSSRRPTGAATGAVFSNPRLPRCQHTIIVVPVQMAVP